MTVVFAVLISINSIASYILIPMDDGSQKNHLKAYGIAFKALEQTIAVDWLLNYRGGSFMMPYVASIEQDCKIRGVSYQIISNGQSTTIISEISDPTVNMDVVKLQKAPKIAVYSPPNQQPWDDAVTLVLTYAEIPYDIIYDKEVLEGKLLLYDWLHLHHEDFTGQYGKFWARYKNQAWYREQVRVSEETAKRHGYSKVSQLKLAVAKKIRDYVVGGGFLFAMCSAPDSYDVALAAENVDICAVPFDGDALSPNAPYIRDLIKHNLHYILGVKPKDHKFLFNAVQVAIDDNTAIQITYEDQENSDLTHKFVIVNK